MVLGHFAQAAAHLACGQGVQSGRVAQHGCRLPEGADQVLALWEVDAGLATDRCVDLGQQCGGDVNHGQAAVVGGGGEAGHVGDHPSAYADHGVAASQAPGCEGPAEFFDGGQCFGRLTVRDGKDSVVHARVHGNGNVGLGDDSDPLDPGRQYRSQFLRCLRADQHGVGPAFGQCHLEADHRTAPSVAGKASTTRAPTIEMSNPSVSITVSAAVS